MNVEFINPFLASLLNVLSTMAQTELKPGKPRIKKDEIACGDVSGLIGMVGPQTRGSFSITFDESLALTIMERMLGERPDSVNEEVTDMVGEITNMVTGGAKNLLGEKGYDFDMATPIVVSGSEHTITHKSEGAKILIPFTSDSGNANIEVSFDKL
ncbi:MULTISPECIES: chemotaxis protein CheX [unclassified Pseudoalteromonas]|uniref:chemotaxis protein CheX n=1 Tax=unclassified Pseudoalteromonas TaxID=194690 RepID=UPI000B3C4F1A|nr:MULTISPECIES: chemotaxis protein CheX [unclassified Pseudoalteromonas]MDN3379595.1 chemotaxis protein CheX [Pseudoalteromonas sp. APC 3893]MDN3387935.1 chemotaxis protein CheX [Pseudoalteromonas sp. APC 4017]OUS74290.1 chemotaxis protein CheX [Pseudoalteromonas sp. A601]